MTILKDYLGSLVGEISQARAMADVESAKIAQLYAANDLLKHFSVPRFRAQNIELTIPIALQQINKNEVITKNYQPIDNAKFNVIVYQTIKDTLKVASLEKNISQKVTKIIADNTAFLERDIKAKEDIDTKLKQYVQNIAKMSLKLIMSSKQLEKIKEIDFEKVAQKLNENLYVNLLPHIEKPAPKQEIGNLEIIAEAYKLKELPQNSLIQIKMTLTEEGMEWQTMENENGEIVSKLLPE